MSKWLAVGAVVALVTGCNYGNGEFACATNAQCTGGADGVCETNQRCSFAGTPSADCPSGRHYGDLSGGVSGQCVDGQAQDIDAGIDGPETHPTDALVCYGTGIVQVCFASAPTQELTLPATIDTSDNTMCAQNVVSGGTKYCVIVATTITINVSVRAAGPKPLVLIASDSITSITDALLDVSSRRVRPNGVPEIGAGADPAGTGQCPAGKLPTAKGGGAGGSFTGLGGAGGDGDTNNGVPGAVIAPPFTELRGGCPGQDGKGTANSKGHGGGAVFLIAGTKIEIAGGISAGGEGGTGGTGGGGGKGGGGGGAGGMIGLDAPTITITSPLVANGGGGGEGGSSAGGGPDGTNGGDGVATAAASGGGGASASGGDGGAGSSGVAAGAGVAGMPNNGGGAGGGGGGAGLIKAPVAAVGANASPAATP